MDQERPFDERQAEARNWILQQLDNETRMKLSQNKALTDLQRESVGLALASAEQTFGKPLIESLWKELLGI